MLSMRYAIILNMARSVTECATGDDSARRLSPKEAHLLSIQLDNVEQKEEVAFDKLARIAE